MFVLQFLIGVYFHCHSNLKLLHFGCQPFHLLIVHYFSFDREWLYAAQCRGSSPVTLTTRYGRNS